MNDSVTILIIDDEEAIRDSCSQVLIKEGYQVKTSEDGLQGLKTLRQSPPHVIFLDLKLPGISGMDILGTIKEEHPEIPVIIITGFSSIESAVTVIKRGAFDYLAKPFSPGELRIIAKKAIESRDLYIRNSTLPEESASNQEFDMVVGHSDAMKNVMSVVMRVSSTDSTVLISGESGTGKELLAQEIHSHSLRKNAPFVVIDCGALVETLFESELFGHVKGSFTGAHETKHGRFEVAQGGTVFLDEISNISINIQAKLLRVIQEKEITRIGSNKPIKIDVRIIAATNENLAESVRQKTFREDLFYRLSVVPINLPPLRERKEDIPQLVDHFLQKFNRRSRKSIKHILPAAKKALAQYDWPGNIRELENTIERAVVLAEDDDVGINDLIYHGIGSSFALTHPLGGKHKNLAEIEKEYIRAVLQNQHGNKSKTAKILEIDRKTLLAKIKKYGIS